MHNVNSSTPSPSFSTRGNAFWRWIQVHSSVKFHIKIRNIKNSTTNKRVKQSAFHENPYETETSERFLFFCGERESEKKSREKLCSISTVSWERNRAARERKSRWKWEKLREVDEILSRRLSTTLVGALFSLAYEIEDFLLTFCIHTCDEDMCIYSILVSNNFSSFIEEGEVEVDLIDSLLSIEICIFLSSML